ncbi:hypothetical protein ACSS6W_010811 [Trichoderma asperelloides]
MASSLLGRITRQGVRNGKLDHRQRTTAQPLFLPPWPGPPLSRIEGPPQFLLLLACYSTARWPPLQPPACPHIVSVHVATARVQNVLEM